MHAVLEKAAADQAADRRRGQDRRALPQLHGRGPRSRPWAPSRWPADLAAIRAAKTRDDIARLMGADAKQLRRQRSSTPRSTTTPRTRDTTRSTWARAASACPTATTTWRPRFAAQKAAYEAYVAQMLTLAGWAEPGGQRQGDRRHRDRDRQGLLDPGRAARRRQDLQPLRRRRAGRAARPASTGTRFLAGADLAKVDRVIVAENTAFPKIAAIYAKTAAGDPEGLAGLHTWSTTPRPISPRTSTRPTSSSATRRCPASPAAAAALEARRDPRRRQRSARRSASSTSPPTSRRRARPRWRPWSATSAPP